jgi:hypothetical protein
MHIKAAEVADPRALGPGLRPPMRRGLTGRAGNLKKLLLSSTLLIYWLMSEIKRQIVES